MTKFINLKWVGWVLTATYRTIHNPLRAPWRDVFQLSVYILFTYTPLFLLFGIKLIYDLSIIAFMVFYVFAGVYLVVECFPELAHLPDSAYLLSQRSRYVPHIAWI